MKEIEEEVKMEEIEKIVFKGTELSEAAKEFWKEQQERITYQLKIISTGKWILKNEIAKKSSAKGKKVVEEFETALQKRVPFQRALEKALAALEGEREVENYLEFCRLIKEKKPFEEIISFLKQILQESGQWSEWREQMYHYHLDRERALEEILKKNVATRPIWREWLAKVRGIGLPLAAQILGGFESALGPGETLASHFKTASQMNAFAGLHVVDGKAPKRERGQKLTFNAELRVVLIARFGASILRQPPEKSGYRRLYDKFKKELIERFQKEGKRIIPSSQLPKKNGKKYEPPGIISEGHLHQMALRKMVKIFVHHLWEELQKEEGRPAGRPYVIEILRHSHYIAPIRDKGGEPLSSQDQGQAA